MTILEKVLWAVDFDSDHKHSLEKVGHMMDIFGHEIILLHVLPNDLKGSSLKNFVEKNVKSELGNLKSELSKNGETKVSAKIVYGNIVENILEQAEKEDVNLIIVNAGDPDTGSPTRLGLNAQRVVRNARKPVGVITHEPQREKKHVVCPVDFSEPSRIALQTAILSARKLGHQLKVISVFEPIEITSARLQRTGVDEKAENQGRLEQYRKEFKDFISGFDFLDVEYETELLQGKPHVEIVRYSRDANILYMGSTGKTGLKRILIGSVTERVIQEVPCTIIATKYEELFKLRILTEIDDIDGHYQRGNELTGLGYYKEALAQFKMCLQVNDMHLPSIKSLAEVYEKLGDKNQSAYYKELGDTLLRKIMDRKIEAEIRTHLRSAK